MDSSHVCEYGGALVKCVRAWGVVDNDPRAILKLLWDETMAHVGSWLANLNGTG